MDRPFLQTPEWLSFQRELGRKIWRLDDGFLKASVIQHDGRFGQNFLSVPYGPEMNLDLAQDGLRNDITHFVRHLRQVARQQNSIFVRLEPMHDMVVELFHRFGVKLRKARRPVQPHATIVMDLTKSVDTLLDKMHHKHRYNINLSERKGVTIEQSDDIDAFYKLLQKTAEHDDFHTHTPLYYRKLLNFFSDPNGAPSERSGRAGIRTRLYLAHYGGQPVAGVIILENAKTAYYLHGASDRDQRALMAPHLMHWKLIQQYKQAGYKWYDFWGIDSNQYPGVTRFKLGFGGQHIEYPGAFDIVLRPWAYRLYKLLRR